MKTFAQACVDYHAACEAVREHQQSDMAVGIRTKKYVERFNAYSDMIHWPQSPLLVGMGDVERAELKAWGDQYAEQLRVFHANTENLIKARYVALSNALQALGYETANRYLATPGAFDERVHGALAEADRRRKTDLDGIGYVCVREEDGNFAKGFFKASGLKRTTMFADLKRCAELRQGSVKAEEGELERFGMKLEVCDESR